MKREFTGKHMAGVMVGGFGIVIAVNLFMATLAVGGFGGVVVENSYLASQKFNGWLAEARRQEAFGWQAEPSRSADNRLLVTATGVPTGAHITADLRRPLGQPEHTVMALNEVARGRFSSAETLPPGRWIVRLTIAANGDRWTQERHLP